MKKALIVGINNYPNNHLNCCENDADALNEILSFNGDGSPNFDVICEKTITSKAQLKKLITELFSTDSNIALFYFSGHGYINELGGYIVTPDATAYDEGVSMNDILILANNSKSKNKIIILDCCHAGSLGSPKIVGEASMLKEGVTILTSSKASEVSVEDVEFSGHGLFTNLLLDGLRGGAADLRGYITPGSIYSYIDQSLGAWNQRPVFKTNITQFTSIRTVTPQVPLEIIRKIIQYFPNPYDEVKLDPSFEFTNSQSYKNELKKPYADDKNTAIFKDLQKMESVGLINPINEEHMYFAAMNSKSCKLTALGYHYWRLVSEKRI